MAIVSSTVGSGTRMGWKRRSRAESFSMCSRYSSSVVAPTHCSSPRASMGFIRLEASIAPSAAPAPDDVVQLVDEEHDVVGALDFVERALEALLELAAVLGAGDHGAQIEGQHAPPAQDLGHVADHDLLGEAFGDGRLADAGLADQGRVVLGPPAEHLDDALDLGVAADHRVEAAVGARAVRSRVYFLSMLSPVGAALVVDAACRAPRRAPAAGSPRSCRGP